MSNHIARALTVRSLCFPSRCTDTQNLFQLPLCHAMGAVLQFCSHGSVSVIVVNGCLKEFEVLLHWYPAVSCILVTFGKSCECILSRDTLMSVLCTRVKKYKLDSHSRQTRLSTQDHVVSLWRSIIHVTVFGPLTTGAESQFSTKSVV